MKLLDPHWPESSEDLNAEALIEEARQRQRRRWLFIGIVVVVLAVAAGIWAASNGGSATKPPSTSKKPGHSKSAAPSSSANRGATSSSAEPFGPWVLAVSFPTASHGFASVAPDCADNTAYCYLNIETTLDGGVTWQRVARLVRPVMRPQDYTTNYSDEATNDLWFANPSDGVLFGASSSIVLITHDGGRHWNPLRVPGVVVQAFSLGREFILVTEECSATNRGNSTCGPSEIVAIPLGRDVVASAHRLPACNWPGDVVTAGSTLLVLGCEGLSRSENAGATWEHIRVPFKLADPLLAAHGSSDLWVMDTFGAGPGAQWKWIYRSLNGGAKWQLIGRVSTGSPILGPSVGKVPLQGYAFMLVASSAEHVLLLSNRSGVSATFDGGHLWVSPASASNHTYGPEAGGMACAGTEDCWAGLVDPFPRGRSVILRTINGGRTWSASKVE